MTVGKSGASGTIKIRIVIFSFNKEGLLDFGGLLLLFDSEIVYGVSRILDSNANPDPCSTFLGARRMM